MGVILNELIHFLNWMKNTLLFTYSTNILVRARNPKMYHPILVTLMKMRPYYSQSSRENATPSRGTSPLASYKEVAPGTIHLPASFARRVGVG